MYKTDREIPVKRVRKDASTGGYVDTPFTEPFLKGPIPMAWLKSAAELPGKALHLGIAIWWLYPMSKTRSFKLTRKALDYVGISRDAAYDALKRLEERRLVRVERLPGQRPTVQILQASIGEIKLE
jgi:hypothetical protein